MTEAHPDPLLHHLRHLIGGVSAAALTDGQLLERFLADRDETAVEVLVRRYGPLVLGVCRRVLHDPHAAEDAFQATFLVLIRKAPALHRGTPLASYLYTVAYRLALRARANQLRRQRCELQAARTQPSAGGPNPSPSDLAVALEEELHRLPERHRAALVLCYLEGKTNEQAAQVLGCPRGSMAARLAQARQCLRDCLARRGFIAPAAAIATALATAGAQTPVPPPLLVGTVRTALWFGRGDAPAALFSTGAVALARRALRTMVLNKLGRAGALLLAVALLGTGATMLLEAAPPAGPPSQLRTKPSEVPGPLPAQGANAALPYGQAFIALRRGTGPVGEKKLREECLTMPLDAQARQVVARAAYALRMLQQGAVLRRCDWAIDFERGIDVPFTRADGAELLSALACLRARLRFEAGKSAEAIDDVVAALTLARHVGQDGTLDSLRAGYRIEHRMIQTLALDLPKLDARTLEDLKKRLDALPPGRSPVPATIRMQENLLSWIVGEVKEATDRESLLAFLGQLCGVHGDSPDKRRARARDFLAQCGGTAKGVLEHADQMRRWCRGTAKKLDLAPDRLEKEWERERKERARNPVFRLFAPVLDNIRRRRAVAEVRRALLSAALAVQRDGKAALKDHPDPVVGGPFDYVGFKGGFELRSRWKPDERGGQPVPLAVGRRGK
jgi:RNA polymerase sigma factor (sigma-70 family)